MFCCLSTKSAISVSSGNLFQPIQLEADGKFDCKMSVHIVGGTLIIMVIFKCYFSGEQIALSINKKTTTTV